MMIVILAEKPSAMRNFAAALGGPAGVYNGEMYRITSARGHLLELREPDEQDPENKDALKDWSIDNMPWDYTRFSWAKSPKSGCTGLIRDIREDIKDADEVVIATDDDPSGEGEMLAWEILLALKWKGKTTRMYFADESVKEVRKAFENRKVVEGPRKDGDYQKALARQRFDFLSMQYTRMSTYIARSRGMGFGYLLRQGRLKSVMVSLVGAQEKAYNEYVKKPYYEVRYRDDAGNGYRRDPEKEKENIRFGKKEDVDLSPYKPSEVVVDSKIVKHTAPRKLLDLAGIVAIMAGKGVKAKEVTDTYQKMYEHHIVSYPRTEDKTVTPEQFSDLLPIIDDIASLVSVDPKILTHRTPRKTHVKASGAHGANRPGTTVPKSLRDLTEYGPHAADIYTLVAKSYLAMLAEDYEYEKQQGHIKDHPEFKGVANVPLRQGFRAVFDTEKEEEAKPLGSRAESFIYEGANTRPQRPTVKWLVKRLEKYNVGTGATRSNTLAQVTEGGRNAVKSQLMTEKKGVLSLTKLGNISCILLQDTKIASPEVTEHLFSEMQSVGKFQLDKDVVIGECNDLLMSDMQVMMKNSKELPRMDERKIIGECPLCGEDVVESPRSYSCSGWRDGCGFTIWKEMYGTKLTEADAKSILEKGETDLKDLVSKAGKPYKAKIAYNPEEKKMELKFPDKKTVVGKCPVCGKDVVETARSYGCSGWRDGCRFTIWKEISGRTLDEKDVKKLLQGEKTDTIRFTSKKSGKRFTARLMYSKEEERVVFCFDD